MFSPQLSANRNATPVQLPNIRRAITSLYGTPSTNEKESVELGVGNLFGAESKTTAAATQIEKDA